MNRERAERGPGGPQPHNRLSGGYRSTPPSPRPPMPSASGPQPGVSPSDRHSPLSGRAGAYVPHHSQGSPCPTPGSGPASPYTPASPGGQTSTPASASTAPSPSSPPSSHGHTVPHSHSLPHSLSEAVRTVNGGMFVKWHDDGWTARPAHCFNDVNGFVGFFFFVPNLFSFCQNIPKSPKTVTIKNSPCYKFAYSVYRYIHSLHGKSVFALPVEICLIQFFSVISSQLLALLNQQLHRTHPI